ncbi:MAG: hypothetical protein VYD87_11265 [Pseudomonadota bacterium]|nr:hypothetical protein [Pseudomonadota bacterium]
MPLPLALLPALGPVAAKALGAPAGAKLAAGLGLAVAGWAALRRARRADGLSPASAAGLDATPEGVEAGWRRARDARAAETSASAAWRGVIRIGADGPGVVIDAAALARLRLGIAPRRPSADARAHARRADPKETAR